MPPKKRKRKGAPSKSAHTSSPTLQPVVSIPDVDIFTRKEIQMQYQSFTEERIMPTNALQENGEIIFEIRGDPERFLDPRSIILEIDAQLVNGDGTGIGPNNAAPIVNLGGSMFSRVMVTIGNSTQITSSNDLYPYLSYLEMVLKSSEEFKRQNNYVYFIWEDTPSHIDEATVPPVIPAPPAPPAEGEEQQPAQPPVPPTGNLGYVARKTQATGSGLLHFNGIIISPITRQDKLIIPQIDLTFSLLPSRHQFVIQSAVQNPDQKLIIRNIDMKYRKVRLNDRLHMDIKRMLVCSPAIYPVTFQKVYQFAKLAGVQTAREIIFTEKELPSTVFLIAVETARKIGSYTTVPFLITSYSEMKIISGGDVYPPLSYKLTIRDINDLYLQMKQSLGSLRTGMDNGLTMTHFMGTGGYGLICFDLSRTGKQGLSDIPKIGDMQLHLDYQHLLGVNATYILIMGLFGATMSGKTHFVIKLIKNWKLIYPEDNIRKILIIHKFGVQPLYRELINAYKDTVETTTEFGDFLLDPDYIGRSSEGTAIILLDDTLHLIAKSSILTQLIIGGVHHMRICLFLIGQNLYADRSANYITCQRNLTVLVLFRTPRDATVLSILGRQLYPGKNRSNNLIQAFKMAENDLLKYNNCSYPYLIVDCSVGCSDRCKLRSGMIDDKYKFCYVTE